MSQILVISAHQDLNHSVSNALILNELNQYFGNDIHIRKLSELYPDFQIDVQAEQQALINADVIVLQYPIFWFDMPAILKKWLDDVWLHGFAYGTGGDKLQSKKLLVSTTTGLGQDSYNGQKVTTIDNLVKNIEHSAQYCGVDWQGVYPLYGATFIPNVSTDEDLGRVQSNAKAHATKLIEVLNALN